MKQKAASHSAWHVTAADPKATVVAETVNLNPRDARRSQPVTNSHRPRRGSWHCVVMNSGEQGTLELRLVPMPRWASPLRRQERMVARLDGRGVTFARRDLIPWSLIHEILQITVKPIRGHEEWDDSHFLVFSPVATYTPQLSLIERLARRRYGSPFVICHEAITPDAQTILAAIRHLTDVPIRDASER